MAQFPHQFAHQAQHLAVQTVQQPVQQPQQQQVQPQHLATPAMVYSQHPMYLQQQVSVSHQPTIDQSQCHTPCQHMNR